MESENEEIAKNILNSNWDEEIFKKGADNFSARQVSFAKLQCHIIKALDTKDAQISALKAENEKLLASYNADHDMNLSRITDLENENKKLLDLVKIQAKRGDDFSRELEESDKKIEILEKELKSQCKTCRQNTAQCEDCKSEIEKRVKKADDNVKEWESMLQDALKFPTKEDLFKTFALNQELRKQLKDFESQNSKMREALDSCRVRLFIIRAEGLDKKWFKENNPRFAQPNFLQYGIDLADEALQASGSPAPEERKGEAEWKVSAKGWRDLYEELWQSEKRPLGSFALPMKDWKPTPASGVSDEKENNHEV